MSRLLSNRSSLPSKLTAILIGINEYNNYPHLRNGTDADKIKDFLDNEFRDKIPHIDITLIKDKDATREKIIEVLSSLQNDPQRNSAILVFFSGYCGITKSAGKSVGMICSVDIGKDISGIPDKTLIQMFDNIARARGNNITFFLDCNSNIFTWENPNSFVVVAPRRVAGASDDTGGAFAKSLINILRAEKKRLQLLTVQSLVDKMQADLGKDVHCYGQNVDRPLFNSAAPKAHHAFASGKVEKSGKIILAAGDAHGVQKDAIYGIYPSNIKNISFSRVLPDRDQNTCLGHLHVSSVDDATSATLDFVLDEASEANEAGEASEAKGPYFSLPTVFYAVETYCPDEKVGIFVPPGHEKIESSLGGKLKPLEEANITLKVIQDKEVGFAWNGVVGDCEAMRQTEPDNFVSVSTDSPFDMIRTIRSAARFTYHLSRSSPNDSSISAGLEMELRQVDVSKEDINVLDSTGKFVELEVAKGKPRGPFYLVLRNTNTVDVWPFIFICEPARLSILPWYSPPTGTIEPPLGAGKELTVGLKNEDGLQFQWRPKCHTELSYIKIFVTTERTRFPSLIQYGSPLDYELREYDKNPSEAHPEGTPSDCAENPISPSDGGLQYDSIPRATALEGAKWAAIRITIKRKYVEDAGPPSGPDSDSDSNSDSDSSDY